MEAVAGVRADCGERDLLLSCAIYTHTPTRTSSTNFQLYYFLHKFVLQPGLGMGMGINGTAQSACFIYCGVSTLVIRRLRS